MRVVKEAEERRNEILDVAEELFAAKGYDNASTNDILERIGIARGPCTTILNQRKRFWMRSLQG